MYNKALEIYRYEDLSVFGRIIQTFMLFVEFQPCGDGTYYWFQYIPYSFTGEIWTLHWRAIYCAGLWGYLAYQVGSTMIPCLVAMFCSEKTEALGMFIYSIAQ